MIPQLSRYSVIVYDGRGAKLRASEESVSICITDYCGTCFSHSVHEHVRTDVCHATKRHMPTTSLIEWYEPVGRKWMWPTEDEEDRT